MKGWALSPKRFDLVKAANALQVNIEKNSLEIVVKSFGIAKNRIEPEHLYKKELNHLA